MGVTAARHLPCSTESSRRALTEPESECKAPPAPQASPEHPKQRHMCAESFLILERLEYQLQTEKETEKLREKAAKKHQISQDNMRHTVLKRAKPKRLLHLCAEWKGAQRCRQGHQPAGCNPHAISKTRLLLSQEEETQRNP